MSEFINNREYRQNTIKSILKQLHEGKSVEDVREQFSKAFDGVSAEEISQAEQALIQEGMPVEEIQGLCDVHAEVFKGSIEEIHQENDLSEIPGHPANTLKLENRALEELLKGIRESLEKSDVKAVSNDLERLYTGLDIHYKKKENLFFPYMEQYGITAPPKVMWGVDDEIRELLKGLRTDPVNQKADEVFQKIEDMIFKEENILLPILLENLTLDEWKKIVEDNGEFGYCLIDNVSTWAPEPSQNIQAAQSEGTEDIGGVIKLPSGSFSIEELTQVLNTLPIDITFVGKDDTVRYFSQSNERVFPRTLSIIGRQVSNCHPPASVHIVEKLVEDFKNGVKESEDFWIPMGDKFILIRYFAVRDVQGEYLGVLEVTQNIAPIQKITGEKRLID